MDEPRQGVASFACSKNIRSHSKNGGVRPFGAVPAGSHGFANVRTESAATPPAASDRFYMLLADRASKSIRLASQVGASEASRELPSIHGAKQCSACASTSTMATPSGLQNRIKRTRARLDSRHVVSRARTLAPAPHERRRSGNSFSSNMRKLSGRVPMCRFLFAELHRTQLDAI